MTFLLGCCAVIGAEPGRAAVTAVDACLAFESDVQPALDEVDQKIEHEADR